MGLLRRIAQRCETHDRAAPAKIARLEAEAGLSPQEDPGLSFTDRYANPDIIDCGHTWCTHRRRR